LTRASLVGVVFMKTPQSTRPRMNVSKLGAIGNTLRSSST